MDQTGDPTGTGTGGPGYQFADEPARDGHRRSTRSDRWPWPTPAPNTNGSQFFIVAGPQGESLAPSYTLFGQVTSGMDVVDKINADGSARPANGTPAKRPPHGRR